MNSFTVKILDPDRPSKLDIATFNNNNIIVENSPILLPADYINSIDTEIVSYLDAGSGINLSPTSSGLTISVSGLNSGYISNFNSAVSGLLPPYVSGVHVYVKNATAIDFTKGQAVYINSAQGNNPTISLAIATAESTSSKVLGLLQQDIGKNQFGYVVTDGILEEVDTGSAIADGDPIWLSPSVSGGLVYGIANKPLAPYHLVFIGYVLRKQQNNGRVFIKPQNGFELGELHNVSVDNASDNGKFLQYNSSSGLWLASNSGNFSILKVNGNDVSISGHNHTSNDIINFNSSVSGLLPVKDIISGTNTTVSNNNGIFTINSTATGGATISNFGLNRLLISDGSTSGIVGQPNLTFNGSLLNVTGSGTFSTLNASGNLVVSSTGDISTLKINKFYHNNLAVATGLNNNDLFLTIIDPTGSATTEVIQGSVLRSSLLNQPAVLRFRQGTEVERLLITPASGEPIWTTDSQKFYIGDGTTVGGDFIGPGPYIRSSGIDSVAVSNSGCVASGNYGVVGGGINNKISNGAIYDVIGGGLNNTAGGGYNTIAGGKNNNANAFTHATVGGGQSNTAFGDSSTVCGGSQNNAQGFYSAVGGGNNNVASGSSSTVGGGGNNTSSGYYSTIPGGNNAKTTRHGELSHSAGAFASAGDAQHTILVARRQTSNATPNQALLLDNSSARLTLPDSTAWTFSIKISAYNTTDNQSGWWIIRGGIRKNNNVTALVGSLITESGFESSLNTASVSVVADDINDALEIRVTGISGKIIRWVAIIDISQVSFGTP